MKLHENVANELAGRLKENDKSAVRFKLKGFG